MEVLVLVALILVVLLEEQAVEVVELGMLAPMVLT